MDRNVFNRPIKFLLFGHAGYYNRGCEAIVRSTSALIRENIRDSSIRVASFRCEDDSAYGVEGIDGYLRHEIPVARYSAEWMKCLYYERLRKDHLSPYKVLQREAIHEAVNSDVCMSIGGDNYCYGEPVHLYMMDRIINKAGKKLVLWGASIEPESISKSMEEDLKLFDALFVRESISYNAIKQINPCRKLYLFPDPAFTMKKEEFPLPHVGIRENTIGINLSPLIMKYEKNSGVLLESFSKLIRYILQKTDFNILLIPHVAAKNNNDYEVLKSLADQFPDTGRVLLLGTDYTAPQLKGFISGCRFFIGTRTHATIAAYSSCVPTLVVGYSVKARGIARDIFGGEQNYVLPIQSLRKADEIIDGFMFLLEKESGIRKHLQNFMPQYINRAREAVKELKMVTGMGKQEVVGL